MLSVSHLLEHQLKNMASNFKLIKLRIASRPFPVSSASYRPLFSSFTSHPTAIFFKQPQSLVSFASDLLFNRSSTSRSFTSTAQIRRYHQDLSDSSASSIRTSISQNDARTSRLRKKVADLLQDSQILERKIGNFDPPNQLDQFGEAFLLAVKSSILAAKESNGQNWEHALYQALLRAAESRTDAGQSKRGGGIHMKLRAQIGLDDFRLATEILRSKSSQGSSNNLPSFDALTELRTRHIKEDIETLLGGDDFLSQSIGQFPPIKLKSHPAWMVLKRLVVTTLALLPYSNSRNGTFPFILCQTLEVVVLDRVKRQKQDGISSRPRRATLIDLSSAEEMLHERRIENIRRELSDFNFDEVSDELLENVPGIPKSEAQLSRFNPKPHAAVIRLRRRISELWKNEDWFSEYLFPHFPPITLRDHHNLSKLESLASITAAQEEGQYSGYPLIVKKAIRRVALERILDHDSRNRVQKRSDSQILLEDVKRAFKLVEGWRKSNPKEKLK